MESLQVHDISRYFVSKPSVEKYKTMEEYKIAHICSQVPTTTKIEKRKCCEWTHQEMANLINTWGREECMYNNEIHFYYDMEKRMNVLLWVIFMLLLMGYQYIM